MFYPELSTIESYSLFPEIIEKLDTWLAFLPLSEQNKITVSKVSIRFSIDFEIAKSILECCIKIGILEKNFAIACPKCGHIIKISSESKLYDDLAEIENCYSCEEDIEVSPENIFVIYKIIKKPTNSPDKIKALADQKLGNDKINNKANSLGKEFINKYCNPNSIFFNPNIDQIGKLKGLLSGLKGPFKTTKDQGDALEDLVVYLLNLVKCFRASKIIRSSTNQFDCFVRNKLKFSPSFFEDIGSFFIAECKNEDSIPGNTYYKKLIDNLTVSSGKLGILFSVKKVAKTCNIIAREAFLQRKIVVVNFNEDDLNDIIITGRNFLDLLEAKMNTVKVNSTIPLDDVAIYK